MPSCASNTPWMEEYRQRGGREELRSLLQSRKIPERCHVQRYKRYRTTGTKGESIGAMLEAFIERRGQWSSLKRGVWNVGPDRRHAKRVEGRALSRFAACLLFPRSWLTRRNNGRVCHDAKSRGPPWLQTPPSLQLYLTKWSC